MGSPRPKNGILHNGRSKAGSSYRAFRQVNGRHAFRHAVPDGFVEYAARKRRGGRVFYFNFDLAKEIGLIPSAHERKLTPALQKTLLETFGLQIINEYDLAHGIRIPARDRLPATYMATRYLQLQHPDKRGRTSGDGRSIWNGFYRGPNGLWDLQSNGTGATCLSPATAVSGKYFRTGDPSISYGCGRADLLDGVCAAMMSEVLHFNGVKTERILAIIAYPDETSINVRAGKNLLRPAHFFRYLKLEDLDGLKQVVRYYIEREVNAGRLKRKRTMRAQCETLLERIADDFARAAARFESDYIFCWMDWDGDNILCDGSIIDYGSIRQFGLFHDEYRYDDDDRMSTSIREQKAKAKYIVQTFAQMLDYLLCGRKKSLQAFRRHPVLKRFNEVFEKSMDEFLLYKMGFQENVISKVLKSRAAAREVRRFRRLFRYFESIKARRGIHKVEDGITWDAVFCLRDILRELPRLYAIDPAPLPCKKFMSILKSRYAKRKDLILSAARRRKIRSFQESYRAILGHAARSARCAPRVLLGELVMRCALINRAERITGDAVIYIADELVKGARHIDSKALHAMLHQFIQTQILRPEHFSVGDWMEPGPDGKRERMTFKKMLRSVKENREGL